MTVDKKTRVRYLIVAMLFIASCFSYGDRVALSIAGASMQKELSLDPVRLGWLLSGFSWAYVAGQLPFGGLRLPHRPRRIPQVRVCLHRHLLAAPALGARPVAGLPRQRTHRRRVVP